MSQEYQPDNSGSLNDNWGDNGRTRLLGVVVPQGERNKEIAKLRIDRDTISVELDPLFTWGSRSEVGDNSASYKVLRFYEACRKAFNDRGFEVCDVFDLVAGGLGAELYGSIGDVIDSHAEGFCFCVLDLINSNIGEFSNSIISWSETFREVELGPENVHDILKWVKKGFVLDGEHNEEIAVPFFNVHPIEELSIPVEFEFKQTSSRSSSFTLGVKGVSGGFGRKIEINRGWMSKEPIERSWQIQKYVQLKFRNWINNRTGQSICTVSVDEIFSGKLVDAEKRQRHYIESNNVSDSKKFLMDTPVIKTNESKVGDSIEIKKSSYENFKIDLSDIGGVFGIEIESVVSCSLYLTYSFKVGYTYSYYICHRNGHEVFVEVKKSSEF
ncbi:hypothetical protein [Thalassospira profundimaris]|uniref:hypothetical protein n=1 Tax=Thalassospira profundimaris TaxID=502049 RepID=UPI000287190E|nr:hypothetical protein [Thalassospira profundimaris]EKF08171.1 hypothetical protein TH2_11724 [Thalassospira profundimaris WP0211]